MGRMTDPPSETRRVPALVEVVAVLVSFVIIGRTFRSTGFMDWQQAKLGASFLSNGLLFLALPAVALLRSGTGSNSYALASNRLGYHAKVGAIVGSVLLPATMLFPVTMSLGLEPKSWPGAGILASGFALAGLLALWTISKRPSLAPQAVGAHSVLLYAGALAAGLAVGALVHARAPLLTRTIYVLLFVALLEEFFFRGYLQGRLDDVFGTTYRLFHTSFGPGLLVAGVLFGLFHPIMSSTGGDWPWALWTGAVGCIFGFVRAKTGAVFASSIAHGIILLPQVAFAG